MPFEEFFLIIFDRRHIKDARLWTILMLAISFFCYDHFRVEPRLDRQGKTIKLIMKAGRLEAKVLALREDEK